MTGNGKVFVSHAHSDNALCDRYVAALRARGLDVWYDRHDMQAGHALTEVIERELQGRSNFVVILTPASVGSYWVQMEIAAFRDLVARDRSRLLLPVRAGNCEVPLLLRGLKWIDAVQMGFDAAVVEIAKALGAPAHPVAPAPAPTPSPTAQKPGAPATPKPSAPAAKPPTFTKPEVIAKVPTPTMVVDASGKGDFRTITEAVEAAKPGERILVRPGVYREAIKSHRPFELFGAGSRDEVVIEGAGDRKVTDIYAAGRVRLANLTMRYSDGTQGPAVIQVSPEELEIENCDVGSFSGRTPRAHLRGCHVHSVLVGIFLGADRLTIEDCEIIGDAHPNTSGITLARGQVVARRNRITNNGTAIWIQNGGGGIFEDNDLRGNLHAWYLAPDAGKVTRARNLE